MPQQGPGTMAEEGFARGNPDELGQIRILQMPRGNLSDTAIADVVAYIKDLAGPAPRVAGENPYQG